MKYPQIASPRLPVLAAGILLATLLQSPALASKESRRLLQEGASQMVEGRFRQALATFEAATRVDPEDAQAFFFVGVAGNRLGEGSLALENLERARRAGYANPSFSFEYGWASLLAGSPANARVLLEDHLTRNPEHAQAHEFLGRALSVLGESEAAALSFRTALDLDPELEDTVRPYQAALARAAGDRGKAMELLEPLIEGRLDSPVSRALQERRFQGRPAPTRRTGTEATYRFTLGVGTNNNVIALPDAAPLPRDITSRSGNYHTAGVSANFRFDTGDPATEAMAGYSLETSQYAGTAEVADSVSHLAYGYWQRRVNEKEAISLWLSDHFAEVQGSAFRNQFTLQPTYHRKVSENFLGEISYQFSAANYRFPSTQATNRDGTSHALGLGGRYRFPDSRLVGRIDFQHVLHDTDGSDFERDANVLGLSFEHPFAGSGLAQFRYLRTWEDYDNANSLSATGATREDDIDFLQLEFSWPLPHETGLEAGRIFLRVLRNEVSSNVPVFDYDQTTTYLGITQGF